MPGDLTIATARALAIAEDAERHFNLTARQFADDGYLWGLILGIMGRAMMTDRDRQKHMSEIAALAILLDERCRRLADVIPRPVSGSSLASEPAPDSDQAEDLAARRKRARYWMDN